MLKNSKKNNTDDKNILYLHENDAKALGIIEGGVQRVFVDGREVEVTFVDEHEIIPMTAEEKKIYDEAEKLANKYIAEARSMSNGDRYNREQSKQMARKEKEARRSANLDFFSRFWLSNKKTEVSDEDINSEAKARALKLKQDALEENVLEGTINEERRQQEANMREREKSTRSARELRALRREHRLERKLADEERRQAELSRKHKFNVKSDIFTEEELEILQGIISKTKYGDSNDGVKSASKKQKNSKKKSKIKTKRRR